ncbi:MAG: GlxA family transcriptional regulator [Solirubrobacterales bacterium]|nr:GlxA family transcriptional regulator [Solirubrobacterales bacterium]
MPQSSKDARRVVIVAFPGIQTLDVTGPMEVFWLAGQIAREPYEVEVVAREPGPIVTGSGLRIEPHRTLRGTRGPIDTLLVAGGTGVREAENDEALIRWLRSAAKRSRRVTSVCSGAFLLARAGLLDGRRATTHWSSCELLQRRYPSVEVDSDAIFVRDGDVWTSAGVTSGMDLALALVEEDLGRATALEVARWLVLFVKRPGGQSQFSVQLSAQAAESEPLRDLQSWVGDNLDADLSVEALAGRTAMSPRNFARVFRRELGITPAAYVEAVRVERAQSELEGSRAPIDSIARRCGFGSPETMRRAFQRRLGVGLGDYRERFRPALERVA